MVIFIRERRGNEERSGETSGKIVLALATHSLHKHTNIVDWPIDFKANLTLRKYDHFEHKHLFWTAPPTRPATTPPTRDRCRSPSAEAMPTYRHWACGNYPVSAEMSPYTHGANKNSIITHKKCYEQKQLGILWSFKYTDSTCFLEAKTTFRALL